MATGKPDTLVASRECRLTLYVWTDTDTMRDVELRVN